MERRDGALEGADPPQVAKESEVEGLALARIGASRSGRPGVVRGVVMALEYRKANVGGRTAPSRLHLQALAVPESAIDSSTVPRLTPAAGGRASAVSAAGASAGIAASFLLALVFLAALVPSLPETARYHTDEAYYTDAALQMVATGDWVTPRTAEGAPRFQKPIVTYWVVATCYRLFGVSFLTSRIAFLVAGAIVVVLTHRLARRLFRDEIAAIVAAAFMAGNNQLMYAAMRSMPDVLLCLAMTASLLGFAGVLFGPGAGGGADGGADGAVAAEARRRHLALAYLGAGSAMAVKGLLGLVVVLYVWLFVAVRGRSLGASLRSLWAPVPIALGTAIASFWFILISGRHGDAAIDGFFLDQVASRIPSAGEIMRLVVSNAASYLMTPFRDFFPWPELALILAIAARRTLREFWREHRVAVLFVLGWLLLLGVMFSGANSSRPRYLLPAWPLLAALMAAVIGRLGSAPAAERWLGRLVPFLMPIGLAGGAVLVAATPGMDSRFIWAACIWIAATIVLKACARRRSLAAGLVAVSLFMLMVFAVYEGLIRPVLAPSPAPTWTARLSALAAESTFEEPPAVIGKVQERYLAQVRVLSGGRIWPRRVTGGLGTAIIASGGKRPLILGEADAAAEISELGYYLGPCGFVYPRLHARELWQLLRTTDKAAVFGAMARRYVLGVPP